MGVLKIIQTAEVGRSNAVPVPVHEFDPAAGIPSSDLSTSTSSASFKLMASTRFVTVQGDEPMYIQIGSGSATATTTDWLLAADQPFSFKVQPGPDTYIAAEDVS